jgi:hypothetical protein
LNYIDGNASPTPECLALKTNLQIILKKRNLKLKEQTSEKKSAERSRSTGADR